MNKLLQEYSSTLDQAIEVMLVKTAEVDEELKGTKEDITRINGITNPTLKEKFQD